MTLRSRSKTPVETEVALLVVSARPAATVSRIAALREVADYRLEPRPIERITDTFFDARDQRLEERHLALRIRDLGKGRRLITLKGPSSTTRGASRRTELELPLRPSSVARIEAELQRLGVRVTLGVPREARQGPATWGDLIETQRRQTRRLVRDVVPARGRRRVAELAIDHVRYRLPSQHATLDEVEIEAKSAAGERAVETVASALLVAFLGQLRRWPYSKLATGNALLQRSRIGRLVEWIDARGQLKSSAVAPLRRALARG